MNWSERIQKNWIYVLITKPPFVTSVAIVHLGYAAKGFVTCVEMHADGKASVHMDESWLTLPKLGCNFAGGLTKQHAQQTDTVYAGFAAPGVMLELERKGADQPMRIRVETRKLQIGARLRWDAQPTALTVRSTLHGKKDSRPIATQKHVLIPAEGILQIGSQTGDRGQTISLDGATVGLDFTSGYVPRKTVWQWSFAMQGQIAWNFCAGNNLGGMSENAVWSGGKLHRLSKVEFQCLTPKRSGPWRVWTTDGKVDLQFEPAAAHSETTRLGVVGSDFYQLTGRYTGSIETEKGVRLSIEGVPGVLEDQDTLW